MTKPLFATALLFAGMALAADDAVTRAMRDEMARSMRKLQLENLQKPYFIAYRILETDNCNITASFGAITSASCVPTEGRGRSRSLSVEVRVGDYTRDNTNFYAFNLRPAGVTFTFAAGGMNIPIDDNYDEIRRQLWLATDSSYKQALDVYAKKKAALENRTRTGDAPDFSHEPVVTETEDKPRIELSSPEAEATAKALSALFRDTPGIDNSEVRFSSSNYLMRYLNSEGTSFTRRSSSVSTTVTAETQATDGMPLTDFDAAFAGSLKELPSREEMTQRIRALQKRLLALRQAPMIERYTGPVLFEEEAAAELVSQAFAPALFGLPRLVVDDARFEKVFGSDEGSLADKLGGRVLPEFLSLADDPTLREFHGKPLLGGFQVDDDGVKARSTLLVDKGILKTLLHTRALIPNTTASTGSRRGPGPLPSNLLFSASKALTGDQLKAELIRIAQQRGKDYGIVVRRIGNAILSQSSIRSRTIIITRGGASQVQVSPLLAAYKVFPDGHEEMVRNLEILGMSLDAFKDITAVSDTPFVYTAPSQFKRISPVVGGMMMIGPPPLVSIAVPALLFDDLTLQRPTGDIPNLPFSKHPSFDK
jgi:hypothetical protein